jgi:hypothetical protein
VKRSALKKNARQIAESLVGTRHARELHSFYKRETGTIEAGLDTIASRWPELSSPSEADPVFILAAGWRTGSTFLQRILMSSGGTFIWGEPYRHADVVGAMARQVAAFNDKWPMTKFFLERFEAGELTGQWIANLYPRMDDFMAAHIRYFECLLAEPARKFDVARWGFKEIALNIGHARYLKWLFPRAKFLFLYRNPYHAWRSYYHWRNFYETWPNKPVFTPRQFGRVWADLTRDFVERHETVGGLLLRYEDLRKADTRQQIEAYLDCEVSEPASLERIRGRRDASSSWAPKLDYALLRRKVEPLASRLGYSPP